MRLAAKRAVFGSTMLFTTKRASLGNIHMLYQEFSLATPCTGCCLQQKELSWAAWCQFTVAVYCQKSFLPKPSYRNSCFCVYACSAVLMHVSNTELKWMLFIMFQQLFAHVFFFFFFFFKIFFGYRLCGRAHNQQQGFCLILFWLVLWRVVTQSFSNGLVKLCTGQYQTERRI